MAKKFSDTKGKAVKRSVDTYKYTDGEQRFRMFGEILPRYVYWIKGQNGKDIPVECLAFNRETERFDNNDIDPVPRYFPDKKCSWSYVAMVIDPTDGKAKPVNLKKKMFEQIMTAAEDLGDPTDPETGWDIVFKKTKTGSLAFNVEYTLTALRLKPRALTEEERATIEKAQTVESLYPRPSVEEIVQLLEKLTSPEEDENQDSADEQNPAAEAARELV